MKSSQMSSEMDLARFCNDKFNVSLDYELEYETYSYRTYVDAQNIIRILEDTTSELDVLNEVIAREGRETVEQFEDFKMAHFTFYMLIMNCQSWLDRNASIVGISG